MTTERNARILLIVLIILCITTGGICFFLIGKKGVPGDDPALYTPTAPTTEGVTTASSSPSGTTVTTPTAPASPEAVSAAENALLKLLKEKAPHTNGAAYPSVALYYEDAASGRSFGYRETATMKLASLSKLPFALAVLRDASANPDAPKYDFSKTFVYTKDKEVPGSGTIREGKFGDTYTYMEVWERLLHFSDNVAYKEMRRVYGTAAERALLSELGASVMLKNDTRSTAKEFASVVKAVYAFTESDAKYASFMKETMIASAYPVMIPAGVAPKVAAHKYGWDDGSYHDSAIVYDEHPYVLVILTDMDSGSGAVQSYIRSLAKAVDKLHECYYPK